MPQAYVDLFVEQGANFSSYVILTDSSTNSYMNIAESTFSANIKTDYSSANLTANFICTASDAANGLLVLSLNSDTTANIAQGRYVFTLNMTANTDKSRVLTGSVIVLPNA